MQLKCFWLSYGIDHQKHVIAVAIQPMPLWERVYICRGCGMAIARDLNCCFTILLKKDAFKAPP